MTRVEKLERWEVSCGACGETSAVYVAPAGSYGQLIGRTTSAELVMIDAFTDPVFDEVGQLVRRLAPPSSDIGAVFRAALALACDPAPSGQRFDFTGKLHCPRCHSANLTAYGPGNPVRTATVSLDSPTHSQWAGLTAPQREDLVAQVLRAQVADSTLHDQA